MKQRLFILSILAAMLCSCTQREPAMPEAPRHDELAALDTLMQSQPDSALHALLDFNSTHKSLAPFDRHYADLLLSEALFKCDYEQTLRNEVQSSLLYFDSLAAAHPVSDDYTLLSARAHYMNGVGFMESDSVVDACTEYIKALEIMEDRFEEDELTGYKAKFMVLDYTRLMDLFSNCYLSKQSIYYGNFALKYYDSCMHFPWHISYVSNEIGAHYEMLHNWDSARFYYQKALNAAPDTVSLVYRDICSRYTLFCYETTKQSENTISEFRRLIASAENEKELLSRFFLLGTFFYLEHDSDSAQKYLSCTYNKASDIEIKKKTAEWLIEIGKTMGDTTKFNEYMLFLSHFATDREEKAPTNSKLVDLCNSYKNYREERKYEKSRKSIFKFAFSIICVFALALSFSLLLYNLSRKRGDNLKKETETLRNDIEKKQLENGFMEKTIIQLRNQNREFIEQKNDAVQSLEQARLQYKNSLEAEAESHRIEKAAISGRLKQSNETAKELQHKLNSLMEEMNVQTKKTETNFSLTYSNFRKEPICQQVVWPLSNANIKTFNNVNTYSDLAIPREKYNEFVSVTNKYVGNFANIIRKSHSDLTDAEIKVCRLCLLDLEDKEIAVALQKSYQTTQKQMRSILKKTHKEREQLSIYLIDLLFEK